MAHSQVLPSYMGTISLAQTNQVYSVVGDLVDSLDDAALAQLLSGAENDLDQMLYVIEEETTRAMYGLGKQGEVLNTAFDHLDRLASQFEESLRVASYNYFVLTVLPNFDLVPHIIQWGNLIQLFRFLCTIAARDHSKSYTFSFGLPLWHVYRYRQGDMRFDIKRSKDGMIITNEYKLAKLFLSMVREEIENNSILREIAYPDVKNGWGAEEIVTKNGVKITAKSYGSKMRGYHPYWMVVDDFLNESTMYSFEQKQKYINMFHSVIMNMLRKGGQITVAGTPFIAGDLYDDLKAKEGWRVFEFPAILPDGRILYDSKHTYDDLMEKKSTIGSVNFSREIMVKPISEAASVVPYDVIKASFYNMERYTLVPSISSHPMKFKHISVGTDFAFSANSAADWTAFLVVGVDEFDKYWLLHVFRGQGMSYDSQMNALKAININFMPDVFVIETNGAQKIFYDMAIREGLPAIEHTTGVDKYSLYQGLPALAVLFERGQMRFPRGDEYSREMTDLIALQLSSFTYDRDKGKIISVSDHDDEGMALWQAVRGVKYIHSSGFDWSLI